MKRTPWLPILMAAALAGAAGCTTLTPDPVPYRAPAGPSLEAEVRALNEWRQEVRLEQESQAKEIAELKRQVRELDAAVREVQQAVRVQAQDMEAGRERDRKLIIEDLSRRIEAMQSKLAPTPPPSPARQGYEHVVKEGQTLSMIAREYKVGMDAILKANNLKDANSIRVGQKLFIPD